MLGQIIFISNANEISIEEKFKAIMIKIYEIDSCKFFFIAKFNKSNTDVPMPNSGNKKVKDQAL